MQISHSVKSEGLKEGSSNGSFSISVNGKLGYQGAGGEFRGLNVAVYTSYMSLSDKKSFDTHGSEQAARDFVRYINQVRSGNFIVIAVCDEASMQIRRGNPSCADVIKQLGSKKIDSLTYRGAWSMISIVKSNDNGKVSGLLIDEAMGSSDAVCNKTYDLSKLLGSASEALNKLKSLGGSGGSTLDKLKSLGGALGGSSGGASDMLKSLGGGGSSGGFTDMLKSFGKQ